MYTGKNLLERVFFVHKEQLASPFVIYNVTPDNGLAVDRNMILYLLKTSLYGDKFFLASDSPCIGLAWILHVVNLLLILISFICMMIEVVRMLLAARKGKSLFPYIKELLLCILYGCSFGSYIMFCFKYPNSCSQDFRYMNLTLIVNMVFLGTFLTRHLGNRRTGWKVLHGIMLVLTILFAVFTTILFFNCSTT